MAAGIPTHLDPHAPGRRGSGGQPARSRAAILGAALTLLCAALTLGLAREAIRSWPGLGTVPTGDALLPPLLSLAAILAAWVTLVLGSATARLLTAWRAPGGRVVRLTAAALVALTSLSVSPATAVPVAAVETGHLAVPPDDTPAAPAQDALTVAAALGVPETGDPAASTDLVPPSGEPIPQPGWTPTPSPPRPVPAADVTLVSRASASSLPETVVVRRGDTLWDLAARHLGEDATPESIAEEWPRWHAANRAVIGPDPDLLQPGQQLVVPTDEERP